VESYAAIVFITIGGLLYFTRQSHTNVLYEAEHRRTHTRSNQPEHRIGDSDPTREYYRRSPITHSLPSLPSTPSSPPSIWQQPGHNYSPDRSPSQEPEDIEPVPQWVLDEDHRFFLDQQFPAGLFEPNEYFAPEELDWDSDSTLVDELQIAGEFFLGLEIQEHLEAGEDLILYDLGVEFY